MQILYFEKLSQFDRLAEPVTVSIPFARGCLKDAARVHLFDQEQELARQARVLLRWDDGSIKWLLLHTQVDLPGNQSKTIHFDMTDTAAPQPSSRVTVQEESEGLRIDTGVLSFLVPRDGFYPLTEVKLDGQALWSGNMFTGFQLQIDGQKLHSHTGEVEVELEEAGPLRVVILVRGKHQRADGCSYLDYRGRITAYAGKPYVEVEHQFIHREQEAQLSLQALTLGFQPQPQGKSMHALGQGFYRTEIRQSDNALEMSIDAETLLYQANEHFIDSFYGDFWAAWQDETVGLCVSLYQAHQNFPKALQVQPEGIMVHLYPEEEGTLGLLQGVAKTHRMQLHFYKTGQTLDALSQRSLQFQLPDLPALSRAWYASHHPWGENYFPDKLPGPLLSYLSSLHDGRPKAMGMMHFGDAPDQHYSQQGRGQGALVWVNNEYDRPHACTLFYGLSGQRRALDSALVSARHWLDVDICHFSTDPLLHQGLKIHTRDHITGRVTPSHEWVDGFLDYYALTGRREALDVATGVAENIIRHMARPEMRAFGGASVREAGWALRAMVGMALGTHEERWHNEANRLVEMLLGWRERYGALLAPYTSHSMPRVPFMIALTVNSLARYLLIQKDARVQDFIVETVDDMLEHCLGPDGILMYKELPSLQRSAPTPHALEAFTHAYRITGEVRYLKVATRHFAALVSRGAERARGAKVLDASGAVIQGQGGGRVFADKYSSVLIFAAAATPLGLLDWYRYPFEED